MLVNESAMFHDKGILLSWTTRHRYLFFLSIMFCVTFLIIFVNYDQDMFNMNYGTPLWLKLIRQVDTEPFAIKTEGCVIPAMDPLDNTVKKFVEYPDTFKPCHNANYSLLRHNKSHIWVTSEDTALLKYNITNRNKLNCCYSSFFRPNYVEDINSMFIDTRIKYNDCVYFKEMIQKKAEDEYVRVICVFGDRKVYDQFYLFAPKKQFSYPDSSESTTEPNFENRSAYNVLILGIDNVSRLNFHRTMPKTLAYLKEKEAVELMGYNKIGDNSYPNLVALLMGHDEKELKKICHPIEHTTYDDCPLIWHWYKEAGYYTAFGEDSSYLATFNYLRDGFRRTPVDYYTFPFIKQAETYVGNNPDRSPMLCMNDRLFYEVLLKYAEDITETLSDSKLFGFFWEITMSHDFVNYPMLMDDTYEKLLKRLDAAKYLEKTILFLVSDHGIRWGPLRSTKQGYLEERLPFVYVLTPQSFRDNYYLAHYNLKFNARRLTTPFDVHETLLDLIDLQNINNVGIKTRMQQSYAKKRGISLFMPIPSNRTCKAASIADNWCSCYKGKTVSVWKYEALTAGKHLITHINSLLKDLKSCAKLDLEDVIDAKILVKDENNVEDREWKEYLVVAKAFPGNGLFEATMRLLDTQWSVIGTVSRLNFYGDQSKCIDDAVLRNYCFCL